jgi:DNA recombination protein RmuC
MIGPSAARQNVLSSFYQGNYNMDVLLLIIGLAAGAAVGYFIAMLKQKSSFVSKDTFDQKDAEFQMVQNEASKTKARMEAEIEQKEFFQKAVDELKLELKVTSDALSKSGQEGAHARAQNEALSQRLETQKEDLEVMSKKFNLEFENIAAKILEEKSVKFSAQNKDQLELILKPLGENISSFRKKVEEVYDAESKERFSLGKEVEKLVVLNNQISEEAKNLTNALKGNSKTQGDWGQMILENILEQSGLVKGREYFPQEFLRDEDGNPHKNEEGKKMQPDVIVAYPDNRKVIIDSKVSLTAYTRFVAADDPTEQKNAAEEHLRSMRTHIDQLSAKNYQDFAASLDFVMMFVPNEPAYIVALQHDQNLWNYAYNKRILLISPTNLIAALKLIVDLWKREYQSQNAIAIAERGAALYDKFVGFVENLEKVGEHLDRSRKSYDEAFKQLKDGRGNLIGQAESLRKLGVKAKKSLPTALLNESDGDDNDDPNESPIFDAQ